ncbi:hypothetical protein BpHYR1_017860 [Brachionus plicatilis]|uniref:Uncharacterized protein n=1 Tax=Brachionus plicatilis TaxID=10195 RepID=A0A3M7QYL2_BRAPC|nr:hypothetical protein BpHYR1_017860 [Brachionus plicatilis]
MVKNFLKVVFENVLNRLVEVDFVVGQFKLVEVNVQAIGVLNDVSIESVGHLGRVSGRDQAGAGQIEAVEHVLSERQSGLFEHAVSVGAAGQVNHVSDVDHGRLASGAVGELFFVVVRAEHAHELSEGLIEPGLVLALARRVH